MVRITKNILPFIIIIFQYSCYAVPYETRNESPILQLEEKYSVYLDSTWTTEQADALLNVFESISTGLNLHFSEWRISDDDLENGIKIELKNKLKFVTISRNIFPVADAQEVVSPNKDLYYAVVQYITENGTNRAIIEFILRRRYGIEVPSYASVTEDLEPLAEKRYSNFDNADLMLIISVLEEFPRVLRRTSQLKYIVRRIDDTEDRGISTARLGRGCIEFAESTFKHRGHHNLNNARRVIAHEKAHFLWACVFNPQLKAEWRKLGGWYQDSASETNWSTTKDRSAFVTDYAYTENPNEDMAESIAYYFVSPDRLRSCCPEKYELFIGLCLHIAGFTRLSPQCKSIA